MSGFNAGTGYDLASGIGSVDAAQLVNNWSNVKFTQTTTTLKAGTSASSLSTSALSVAHGATVYFQVGVSPSTATGFVVLTSNNAQPNSDGIIAAQLANGVASFNTQALPGGTYTLYARYAGDNTNAGSQSQGIQLTVSSEASILKFNIDAYGAKTGNPITSPVYGSSFFADIIPYGSTEGFGRGNPATGSVTLSQNGTQIANPPAEQRRCGELPVPRKRISNGDDIYVHCRVLRRQQLHGEHNERVGQHRKSSSRRRKPTIWECGYVAPDQYNTSIGMWWDTWSLGAAPTGTITVTMNGTSLGTGTVSSSPANPGEWDSGGNVSMTPAQIGVGNSATFTIAYSGDSNYQAIAPITDTVTVSEPANAGIALTNSGNVTIASVGQSGTATVTVTPSNGFQGLVTLTCSLSAGGTGTDNPQCSITNSVTMSGTTAENATVTISTTPASTAAVKSRHLAWTGLGGSGLLAVGLMIVTPRRRRTWLSLLAVVAVGSALFLQLGCSGGSLSPTSPTQPTDPGTPAGSYTFTITGTHGSITGNTKITVTLQ